MVLGLLIIITAVRSPYALVAAAAADFDAVLCSLISHFTFLIIIFWSPLPGTDCAGGLLVCSFRIWPSSFIGS